MRKILYLGGFLFLMVSVVPCLFAEADSDYVKAYFMIQDGDGAEKSGDTAKAIERYSAALKIIREIKRTTPDWNPNLIGYRSQYCAEHITKAGGKVEPEDTTPPPPPPKPITETVEVVTPPVNTVPKGVVPAPPAVTDETPTTDPRSTDRIANLERELARAREDLSKLREEKDGLEERLKKAEADLKAAYSGGDEKTDTLLKENNALKRQLAETEAKLKEMPSSTEGIASLKAELAQTRAALEVAQKENQELKTANENLKKELEETHQQLKIATSGPATTVAPEVLQTLQRENALLRSIVDRQFSEDAKRMAAREVLEKELKELSVRTESIRSQLEVITTPLTPLSEEENRILKTPAATLRSTSDDPNKLTGVIASPRHSSPDPHPTPKLTNENRALADEARQLFAKGDMTTAATKYEKILQSQPNNIFALSNLGVIHFRQDQT